jgi:hypothetical protein
MVLYLVLHLCLIDAPTSCKDETVAVSAISCVIGTQAGAVEWMQENGYPTEKWHLDRWHCQAELPVVERNA